MRRCLLAKRKYTVLLVSEPSNHSDVREHCGGSVREKELLAAVPSVDEARCDLVYRVVRQAQQHALSKVL